MRRTPPAPLIAVLALVAPSVGVADALGVVSVERDAGRAVVRTAVAPVEPVELLQLRPAQPAPSTALPPAPSPSPAAAARAVAPPRPAVRARPPRSAAPAATRQPAPAPVPAATAPVRPAATSGPVARGQDDYPWRTSTAVTAADDWGFTQRQCPSFVAFRLAQAGRALDNRAEGWGSADHWDDVARARGRAVTTTPVVGSVAHWGAGESSAYYAGDAVGRFTASSAGHVGWVTHVHVDGSVQVEGYNAGGDRRWSSMHVRAPRFLRL